MRTTYLRSLLLIYTAAVAFFVGSTAFSHSVLATEAARGFGVFLASDTETARWRRTSIKKLSFIVPVGKVWQREKGNDQITAMRVNENQSSSAIEVSYVRVLRNTFDRSISTWTAKQIADDFRAREVQRMRYEGNSSGGMYKLVSLETGQEKHSGLDVYYIKNVKQGRSTAKPFYEKQHFYMVFPRNYTQSREFYIILIGNSCSGIKQCSPKSLSVSELLPILSHLEFK